MTTVHAICEFLEAFAPASLAEEWDNVGLLVGDRQRPVKKMMTCLTVTPSTAQEAVDAQAGVIVAHHPLPFRPLTRLTADNTVGRLLLQLIAAEIAVISPHTAFDSAAAGINQRLAEGLQLHDILPLEPLPLGPEGLGAGRWGRLPSATRLCDLIAAVKQFLQIDGVHLVGHPDSQMRRVAVACGSAGQFLAAARRAGCDALVTGETNFHTCLEAEATSMALILPGHYASERFAVESLAEVLAAEFPPLEVWASRDECDPLQWM